MKVADLSTGKMENLMPPLTDQEEEMFRNMMRRLHTVFKVISASTCFQICILSLCIDFL